MYFDILAEPYLITSSTHITTLSLQSLTPSTISSPSPGLLSLKQNHLKHPARQLLNPKQSLQHKTIASSLPSSLPKSNMASTNQASRSQSSAVTTTTSQTFTSEQLERLEKVVNELIPISIRGRPSGSLIAEYVRIQDDTADHFRPAIANPAHQPIGFLSFPPEIRNRIFRHCLVVGKVFPRPKAFQNENLRNYKAYDKPQTQIFELCKQIFEGSAPMYFANNHFVISYGTVEASWPWMPVDISLALYKSALTDVGNLPQISRATGLSLRKVAFTNVNSLSISFDWRDGSRSLSEWLRLSSQYTSEIIEFQKTWDARASIIASLNLKYLEVSFSGCYCDQSHKRMLQSALYIFFKFLRGQPKVVITGLLDGKERIMVMRKIQKLQGGADVEERDRSDWYKIVFRPLEPLN